MSVPTSPMVLSDTLVHIARADTGDPRTTALIRRLTNQKALFRHVAISTSSDEMTGLTIVLSAETQTHVLRDAYSLNITLTADVDEKKIELIRNIRYEVEVERRDAVLTAVVSLLKHAVDGEVELIDLATSSFYHAHEYRTKPQANDTARQHLPGLTPHPHSRQMIHSELARFISSARNLKYVTIALEQGVHVFDGLLIDFFTAFKGAPNRLVIAIDALHKDDLRPEMIGNVLSAMKAFKNLLTLSFTYRGQLPDGPIIRHLFNTCVGPSEIDAVYFDVVNEHKHERRFQVKAGKSMTSQKNFKNASRPTGCKDSVDSLKVGQKRSRIINVEILINCVPEDVFYHFEMAMCLADRRLKTSFAKRQGRRTLGDNRLSAYNVPGMRRHVLGMSRFSLINKAICTYHLLRC
ncbi:hypothetical protein CPB84DRAFT_1748936 [Gymnopilus junonius]|uniref:Uncharacterized protein n=1 Tax=Gymnopilus junonius TaxID=109634 RepID=A0A9P5NLS2_GYMJU|nr:hypothetical protein CPB84DRAFT_1748936 [Gymnopilus junonius]